MREITISLTFLPLIWIDPDEICIAINPRNGMWHDVMCSEANIPACERGELTKKKLAS